MKKILALVISVIMIMSCVTAVAQSNISIVIDGEAKVFDVMPEMVNDRTLVPMRGIFETLGAEISWDDASQTVFASKGDMNLMLQIGSNIVAVNEGTVLLDVPPMLINGRTMVPVRFVSESLGCKVDWIDETQTVVITSPGGKKEEVKSTKVKDVLDGKKVLFAGNSYVYYGNCVLPKDRMAYTWADRSEDKGYFYQLCKENGAEVKVRNWCFSGHNIYNIFDGPCDNKIECKGVMHEDHIEDKYFDYIIISPHSSESEQKKLAETCDYLMNLFTQYNPNVKFVLLGNHSVHGISNTGAVLQGTLDYYKTLEAKGWIIADWGSIIKDILNGGGYVDGSMTVFNKASFINKDGHHENVLCGYLTALTALCAITGEKAEGQPYDFCDNKSLGSRFDLEAMKKQYYGDMETNFVEIFRSKDDMKALQKLVDNYFANN